jgi:hypothetical protein
MATRATSRSGFTHDLELVGRLANGSPVTIGDIDSILAGRGFATICVLLSVPFVQPVPLPGLSIVFGIAIMALGLRLLLGSHAGLPGFIRRQEIRPATLAKIVAAGKTVFTQIEKVIRPRLPRLFSPPFLKFTALWIMANGFALSLPIPPVIPFSNSLPSWSVIALCLGFLERDGIATIAGYLLGCATWIYFAISWEVIWAGSRHILNYFGLGL